MSVRAYRVIQIETAKPNSFNLYQDQALISFFAAEYGFWEKLGQDGGLTELPVEAIEHALAEVELSNEVRETLQRDIDAAREAGDEYVQYYCY